MKEGIMLCRFSLVLNSNKFYEIRLLEDDSIQCRYGRVGQDGLLKTYYGGKRKYDSLIREKTSDKKGYKQVELELVSNAKGNILTSVSNQNNIMDIALKQIKYLDDQSKALIMQLSKENIHSIVNSTSIQYDEDDGLFKTPLGIITVNSINRAFQILEELETICQPVNFDFSKLSKENVELIDTLNAEYFVLVPTKIKDTTDRSYLLYSEKNIEQQKTICNMLFDTVKLVDDLKIKQEERIAKSKEQSDENLPSVFDVTISHLSDAKEIKEINEYYNKTKNAIHGRELGNSIITNIYKVSLGPQQEPFVEASKKIGNVHSFWHGTRIANILSIMSKGLLLPNQSPGAKAGAMFGLGLYFANQSTKSAQYCDGMYWSGGQRRDKIYMFLADVVVGKSYTPNSSMGSSAKPPKGFDSIWAKANVSGVRNDEIIVFNPSQVRLTHLVEISFK